jgi:hypothetical protein
MLEREADAQGVLRAGKEHAERLAEWLNRRPRS